VPSIVIPAHQEERSIAALLTALAPLAGDLDVIVVCNGCTDRTAEVARASAPWARVLDLPVPSKPAALDAGDAATDSFPRMYLDADVRIDAAAITRVFAAVDAGLPAAAASPAYDTSAASWLVRSHHRFWEQLPANRRGLAGTNAMVVSREGRARFAGWPRLIGDDYFLDGLFNDVEKTRVPDAFVTRPASRRFWDCVSRKARIHQGNREVRAAGLRPNHEGGGVEGTRSILGRNPAAVIDLPAYLLITASTRALSWWRRRRGTAGIWFRDGSRV
jgi:glycosyltransferase involved in cell wall biosynthesis